MANKVFFFSKFNNTYCIFEFGNKSEYLFPPAASLYAKLSQSSAVESGGEEPYLINYFYTLSLIQREIE